MKRNKYLTITVWKHGKKTFITLADDGEEGEKVPKYVFQAMLRDDKIEREENCYGGEGFVGSYTYVTYKKRQKRAIGRVISILLTQQNHRQS